MKKIIALILAFALIFAFSACGTENNTVTEGGNESLDGGWSKAASPVISEELAEIFNKAFDGIEGAEYTPVAYLASQVVAGTNHLFLVRQAPTVPDPVETYTLVTIYEDLEGNAEILEIYDTGVETNINGLMGGWEAAESPEITDELKAYFDKAVETLTGADYELIALAATQVVSGTNYCILAESTLVSPDPESSYSLIYLYVDLDGNAEITDIVSLEKASNEEMAMQIANPFMEADDLQAAAELAGFEMAAPESIDGYPEIMIQVIKNEMIEIFYYEGEFGEDGHKEVLIRKGVGDEDISGDYNEYDENETTSINGMDVNLRGEGGAVKVAAWAANGYSYAIDSSEGLTKEEIENMVETIN